MFKHSEETKFSPQPLGRNVDLSRFEVNTIFNLSNREIKYISYKTAYHDYCRLLKKLSFEVYGKSEPYLIEMLLFTISPLYVVPDIENSLSLSLN